MINFKLKEFDKIIPVGQEPDLYLSWYWLTDGDLWLTFGDHSIYEYSKEAITYFGDKPTPYSDYYIVRFVEDFTGLFEKVSESIPEKFYELTKIYYNLGTTLKDGLTFTTQTKMKIVAFILKNMTN